MYVCCLYQNRIGGDNTTYEQLLSESLRIDQQIQSIQAQLAQLPEGKLYCKHSSAYLKWYHYHSGKPDYISKKNPGVAEQLAWKKYLTLCLQSLFQEKEEVASCLAHHSMEIENAPANLFTDSLYQNLLAAHVRPSSETQASWAAASFSRNPFHPENLSIKASSGNFVRSKSEAMIDTALYTHKIPFRYECALTLGNYTFYPDFTLLHPRTEELVYWEHFGMMDNPEYQAHAGKKLNQYIKNGIFPGIQLITTYETAEQPLSPSEIEEIVVKRFLN